MTTIYQQRHRGLYRNAPFDLKDRSKQSPLLNGIYLSACNADFSEIGVKLSR